MTTGLTKLSIEQVEGFVSRQCNSKSLRVKVGKQLIDTMRELETMHQMNDSLQQTNQAMIKKLQENESLKREIDFLGEALNQNCRLLGISGEKELALRSENEILREALEKLARLGNGEMLGNSDGNMIARQALASSKQ